MGRAGICDCGARGWGWWVGGQAGGMQAAVALAVGSTVPQAAGCQRAELNCTWHNPTLNPFSVTSSGKRADSAVGSTGCCRL